MQQIWKEFGMFFREKTIASEEELDGFLLNNVRKVLNSNNK